MFFFPSSTKKNVKVKQTDITAKIIPTKFIVLEWSKESPKLFASLDHSEFITYILCVT